MQQMKHNYEINRLKIQMNDKAQAIDNVQIKNNELYKQVKKFQDKLSEQEKTSWLQEANSDKNPNLLDFYKKKVDVKDKEIKQLKKSQKKFSILEKKLLVKEKAFESERAFYHEQLVANADKVTKLEKVVQGNQLFIKNKLGISQ